MIGRGRFPPSLKSVEGFPDLLTVTEDGVSDEGEVGSRWLWFK